ncbi:MAG: tetrahydrofolate dehydrogenase/cyclohydrolase catalytic domain-containing protein, partial [Clostridia bacterium]
GLNSVTVNLSKNTTTEKLVNKIRELNADSKICGILLQHPTPLHIDEQLCFNEIALNKDVDGVSATSFGNMTNGYPAFKCATPLGIITLLKHYNIIIEGKHAVIVGRSAILGKPTAMLLLQENATVTICHRKTINLEQYVRQADILVAAVGKANLIKSAWLKPNVILIDCGYNQNNVGDIELDNHALSICSAYTPVPGGVGPMTISSLISQAVEAAEIYSAFLPEKRN